MNSNANTLLIEKIYCHVPAGWGLQQTIRAPGSDSHFQYRKPGLLWTWGLLWTDFAKMCSDALKHFNGIFCYISMWIQWKRKAGPSKVAPKMAKINSISGLLWTKQICMGLLWTNMLSLTHLVTITAQRDPSKVGEKLMMFDSVTQ